MSVRVCFSSHVKSIKKYILNRNEFARKKCVTHVFPLSVDSSIEVHFGVESQLDEISLLIPILEELGVVEGQLWHPMDSML